MKAFPKNPAKKEVVIQEIAKISVQKCSQNSIPVPKPLSAAKQAAQNFFTKDSVSTMMPGKRDVKTFIINGQKVTTNVRVLQAPVKELFIRFKDENPEAKIGIATFFSALPKNVNHFSKMPYFSCKCRYHENYPTLINPLRPIRV